MGLLSNIFSKREPMLPFDLSFLKNDIHSHLIPGIDDGAKTIDDSLILAQGFVDLGYSRVVTTPHIMSDYYKNTPRIINDGLDYLHKNLVDNGINLKVEAAAEYYVDYEFVAKIGKEELLTFGDNYILIEFSFVEPPKAFKEAIFELQANGYKPVLAHPERYIYWHKDLSVYEELKTRDVLFQMNILSLIGIYSSSVAHVAEQLIKNKMIDWLGCDLHNSYQLEQLKNLKLKSGIIENINNLSLKNSGL